MFRYPSREPPPTQKADVDKRLRAKFRADYPFCFQCGLTYGLELHHIASGCGKRGDHWLNFTMLCGECHDAIHTRPADEARRYMCQLRLATTGEDAFETVARLMGFEKDFYK